MDAIVHFAIEEICSEGTAGLTLPDLWPKLRPVAAANGLDLCPGVKAAIWTNLLEVPGLQLESQGVSYSLGSDSLILNDVDKCEQINLKIVAPERLRDNFVGIYDVDASASSITPVQRRTLERLAIARTNGITQNDLAKEFGIKGNNIFYILKKLETRGLIVRQSTLVRTKEAGSDREPKNTSVMTNMLYLHRYAKHLGSQKRLEIIKEDTPAAESDIADETTGSGFSEESVKEDVHVKDYLPALKSICDKLEEAEGKVLVVSDIKRDLNYRGTRGHRAWRNICKKLRDVQIVEEFCAKVNNKEVACLRLLKKFSPTLFEAKSSGSGEGIPDGVQLIKSGKRGQLTEQLVELPIEQQIYDMIDSEGSGGLTITEVMKRLGLRNKQYYDRLLHFFSRCGMHLQAESHNRGVAYRVWTSKHISSRETDTALRKSEASMDENTLDPSHPVAMEMDRESAETTKGLDSSTSKDNALVLCGLPVGPEASHGAATSKECENLLVSVENFHNCDSEPSSRPRIMDVAAFSSKQCDVTSLEVSPSAIATTSRRRSHPEYPCLTTADNVQREQRILKMLEEEKILIKADLHRRLENLEKEKQTSMDRKTLERSLNKLQKEGHCKCISFQVPTMTNLGSTRPTEVVLHPSTYDESPEVLCQKILEIFRSFDLTVRRHGYSRLKKGQEVPELDDIQRIPSSKNMDNQAALAEARRATGYVRGRMVRTKLLHIFLWSYLSDVSFGNIESDLNNPHSSWRLFELDAAVRAMPLELYLQVIGSIEKSDDLIEKCRSGLRLSDLPLQEYRSLMDTRAMGRLSRLIDTLRRLQLIRFISTEHEDGADKISQTTLTRALELKPYIEEPVSQVASYPGFSFQDLRPHVRHDFFLSTVKAVEEYWSTLEYCYAAIDSEAALHAFPGSAVPEVFRSRAWNSRPMSADQRSELLKRVVVADPCRKLSFKECEGFAKDFNLTLEQVLRVYHDKRQRCLARLVGDSGAKGEENLQPRGKQVAASRKRKRNNERNSMKHSDAVTDDGLLSEEMFAHLPNRGSSFLTDSLAHACDLHQEHLVDQVESPQEQEAGNDENLSSVQLGTSLKARSERRENFSWTEAADRQLIIEYVRHRAAMGPKYNRIDWSSLSNLPAPPDYCKRRMALLNSSLPFREAVMGLCNLLADRYKKHLEKLQNNQSDLISDRSMLVRKYAGFDCSEELASEEKWDNFDERNIMIALGDVLRHKRLAKLDSCEKEVFDEASDAYDNSHLERTSSAQLSAGRRKLPARRSSIQRFPLKYSKMLSKITRLGSKVYESIAVSNAVELFKLIFLSTSTSPQASSMLAETLRRYSQHDLFAAFSYLREKKAMIGGSGSKPFVLSQLFLQSIYLSPFPVNTGKRALKFASWLEEREKDLMEEEINLPADMQCGDIFHMCALVSSGELSIVPYLPEEGVGEVDSTTAKRKNDSSENCEFGKSKRMRTATACETEISRREKGFPNIRLSLSRVTITRTHALDIFKDENCKYVSSEDPDDVIDVMVGKSSRLNDCEQEKEKEIIGSADIVETALNVEKSPWDAMSSYTEHLFSSSFDGDVRCRFRPELFKSIYLAIQKSGDQGLCMKEISKFLEVKGEKEVEIVVEVLETFGQALKVPAYNSVRIVDPLYRTKYFLTPLAGVEKLKINCLSNLDSRGVSSTNDAAVGNDVLQYSGNNMAHRVTILNHPEESIESSTKILGTREVVDSASSGPIPCTTNLKKEMLGLHSGVSQTSSPILPWINGNGTINELVYKGLTRRLLGIVMQNPGILEDDIISKMGALNPQSCKTLLETLILDNHIIVRKMHQRESAGAPSILGSLFKRSMKKPKFNCREHFFANPMSTTML